MTRGRHINEGFLYHEIKLKNNNYLNHFWIIDFKQLISKHRRYLKGEGYSRYNIGLRSNLLKILIKPYSQFYFAYFVKRGYVDGLLGIGLSIFWAWYQTKAEIKLLEYQIKK